MAQNTRESRQIAADAIKIVDTDKIAIYAQRGENGTIAIVSHPKYWSDGINRTALLLNKADTVALIGALTTLDKAGALTVTPKAVEEETIESLRARLAALEAQNATVPANKARQRKSATK